ncbi:MAG TPA: CHAT domain-containing protein [Anaerolineae bacterium]|nr:CHAT domain-containing protein [Anaerolineae bacterium]
MSLCADLELSLHRHDAETYTVALRLSLPDEDTDRTLGPAEIALDLERLRAESDPAAYGRVLTASLFADPALRAAFAQARAAAQSADLPLRLRLLIGPGAAELHALHWETLRDPEDDALLSTGEQVYFSRYLSSADWRPVRLRPQGDLRALVAIANPTDLADAGLTPLDVAAELDRAREGLGDIPLTVLPANGRRATLTALIDALREDTPDVLYLVAHGMLRKGEPRLFLEDEAGQAAQVAGSDLTARLRELARRPRLIVLASCEGAGTGDGAALTALGPRLAESGIPAVLAMQERISLETVARLMPRFFQEVQRDGQIDRALAVARGAVRDRPDAWQPALFMRLKSGRLWYVPGFGDDKSGFDRWPALLQKIKLGKCTPVLGPGLGERLYGATRDLAQQLAVEHRYPLSPYERESLSQVTQYLAVTQGYDYPAGQLAAWLRQALQRRHAADLPANLRAPAEPDLPDLWAAARQLPDDRDPTAPYRALAALPFPLYLTTMPDDLLLEELRAAGKDPQPWLCPWNEWIVETYYADETPCRSTPEAPLVFYLFGRLDDPETLAVTEDHYFDYLIGVTRNNDLIPEVVRKALTQHLLFFLGFQLDAWDTRVIFRSFFEREGRNRKLEHITAQVDPEEERILEPARARDYLAQFFKCKEAQLNVYWGSAAEFVQELARRWAK